MMSDDALLILEGKVEAVDGQEITLIVDDVKNLADARPRNARTLTVGLPDGRTEDLLNEIYTLLSQTQGRCDVVLTMPMDGVEVTLNSQVLRVEGSARLEKELISRGCAVVWSI